MKDSRDQYRLGLATQEMFLSSKALITSIGVGSAMQEAFGSTAIMDGFKNGLAAREALLGSTAIMDGFKNGLAAREALLGSTAIMDGFKNGLAAREALLGSTAIMDGFKNGLAARETLLGSTAIMDGFKNGLAAREALLGSTAIMDGFKVASSAREALGSMAFMDSFKLGILTQRNLAISALQIPRLNETTSSFFDRLKENELDLRGLVGTFNDMNKSIENHSKEIEDESNDFLTYWNNLYQQVLQQYGVINSSLLFQCIRDLIMVLSFIYGLQGNSPPEINIYNNNDSKVEVEITDEKINIIIEPENHQKNDVNENETDNTKEQDIILNPGIMG